MHRRMSGREAEGVRVRADVAEAQRRRGVHQLAEHAAARRQRASIDRRVALVDAERSGTA